MYWILLLVIALIVHGSLYPWQFHARDLGGNVLTVLLHSWPALARRYLLRDLALNIALYLPLGLFAYLAWARRKHRWLAVAGPVMLGLALSSAVEMAQLFDRTRITSMADVLANTAGAAFGMMAGVLLEQHVRGVEGWFGRAARPRATAALVLSGVWVCVHLYPFFPSIGRWITAQKLRAVGEAGFVPLEAVVAFAAWLAAGRLLQAAFGRAIAVLVYPLLLVIVPLQLLIAGRTFTLGELGGTALAAVLWLAFSWESRPRRRLLAAIFVFAVLANELAPFHFTARGGHFGWIPFQSLVVTRTGSGFVVLLEKAYWYGAAVWLLRASGWRLGRSAAVVAVLLAAGEALQVHLPGRTPESTDPVLALLMAFAIAMLDRRRAEQPARPHAGAPVAAIRGDELLP